MQIEAITSVDELREKLMMEEIMDLLVECGYSKSVPRVVLEDKPNIIQTITLHTVILASLAELSQFHNIFIFEGCCSSQGLPSPPPLLF